MWSDKRAVSFLRLCLIILRVGWLIRRLVVLAPEVVDEKGKTDYGDPASKGGQRTDQIGKKKYQDQQCGENIEH